ncbi:hypothetical protein [Helicobacter sp. WB40]|uniref:hypothetical protein n=1 Tax=Helicobacter sp. WB40 TaxID=3004130 RepID=UPI0022EBEF9F|nr:hypothetical protein [Helicobacter sp. WB40]MDA3966373.1 hypothetical protein [Helicobacter sp. WB40]
MSNKYVNGGFYKLLPYLSLALIVCIIGVYFANLMFGANSLSILLELHQKEQKMQEEVRSLTEQNANLQKEFFELKGLEPK